MASPDNPFEEGADTRRFLDDLYKVIVDEALAKGCNVNTKVVDFQFPEKLSTLIDTEIKKEPESHDKLLDLARQIIQYSVKTGNPRFFNQQYGGLNPYSLAGSWLSDSLNTNLHTFEVAPAFVILEKSIFRKLCGLVGFSRGDGVFCPGGSFAVFMAIHLARYKRFPELKKTGMMASPKFVLFASQEVHYSVTKGAGFLGFGTDNVISVKSDDRGKMIPADFENKVLQAKERGEVPLFVMATGGSTVLGCFDPLPAVADICQEHDIWMHTDACWGGTTLLSAKHKHLLDGIHRSDSVSWNFHKMGGALLQCSAFLVKEMDLLRESNALSATYLFQKDKFYDTSYDIGDNTVQCGRKVDVVKLWFMWKALGDRGMESRVDKLFETSQYFTERLKKTEGFRLVIPKFECTNVCFWYIPPSMRGQPETPEWWEKLSKVAPVIKERMVMDGSMMIGYNPLLHKDFVNFFRIVFVNERQTKELADFVLEEISRLGKDL
ncbi:cysteine sulfinic acid decarboxylase-like isoform X2 [Liolophura sinensis]